MPGGDRQVTDYEAQLVHFNKLDETELYLPKRWFSLTTF